MPKPEARQFRALYRFSLARLVDLEIIASRGDLYGLFARTGGVFFALSLMLMAMVVAPYVRIPVALRSVTHMRNDEEFLVSITLAVAGLFSVLAWNNVLPDRRDCLVLGTLPVRTRTIALSRLAAIFTCIGVLVVVVNVFTGFTFPYLIASGPGAALRCIAAWWITMLAAGIFAFGWMLAVQGTLAQVLPWHTFLRASAALQLASLFVLLGFFFLTPPFSPTLAHDPGLAAWLPSYWFTGLLNALKGDADPAMRGLAAAALRNFAVVMAIAGAGFALSWFRHMRSIVETPDIASRSGQTLLARCGNRMVKSVFRHPLDRAILLFTARTATRSRQHRLLLAAYGGIGFALALTFAKGLFLVSSQLHWTQPSAPLLVIGMLLLLCSLMATRSVFALPHSLPANWIFRITAVQSPAGYFGAVRKSLVTLAAVPVWTVCGAAVLWLWPGRISIEASLLLVLVGLILVDYSLYQFRKLPFACSWLPASGQSLNTVRALAYAFGFLLSASALGNIELWAIRSVGRFVVLAAILGAWAVWLRRRGRAFAGAPGNALQFDEMEAREIFALDLRPDGEWSSEQAWVDAIDSRPRRSMKARLQAIGVISLAVMAAGYLYERVSEWRDNRSFPHVGRSVDIGGRRLNLACAGQGSPTVVMESGGNQPGFSWVPVQQGVSAFTRACWYDRAGYGWSDPAPDARTSADIAEDLHRLLHAAGIAPPYVLVGHSFGGFNVRLFAAKYGKETAGLVLVDSASEHENTEVEIPRTIQSPAARMIPRSLWLPVAKVGSFLSHEGVLRLLDDGPGPAPAHGSEQDWAMMHALRLQSKFFDTTTKEGLAHDESSRQVRAIHSLGDMPLIVLTAGRRFSLPSDPEEARRLDAYFHYRVYVDQPRMLALSTRARQVVIQSGHGIPMEAPDAVTKAVREVLADGTTSAGNRR